MKKIIIGIIKWVLFFILITIIFVPSKDSRNIEEIEVLALKEKNYKNSN